MCGGYLGQPCVGRVIDPDDAGRGYLSIHMGGSHAPICLGCFVYHGRPDAVPSTPAEAERARQEVVRRMQARGGAHAHLVRKGLT